MNHKKKSMLYILLCINLCSITILSAFNYFVFHNMNSKAYLESFEEYSKRVTNLAFRNIDKQVMGSLVDIPQLYFSDIKMNEPILLPQKNPISDSPKSITALVEKLEEIQKGYPYVISMDIYYEGTRTVVTGYNRVHFPLNEKEVNQYLPWYFGFENLGVNQYFFGLSNQIYPSKESVVTYVKRIAGLKWRGQDIVVAFHISPDSFREYIDESKGVFVLTDKNERILYQSQGSRGKAGEVLGQLYGVYGDGAGGDLARSVQMKLEGEPLTVFSNTFPLLDLNYVYYMPDSAFLADYHVKSRIFLVTFGMSIMFNILIFAGVTYINYTVYYKRVLVISKEAGISIGEEGRSFDGSLTALSHTISGLNETVRSSEGVLCQNSLRSLILNRKSEQAYAALYAGCALTRVWCFIVYIEEQDWEGLTLKEIQDRFNDCTGGMVFLTTLERGEVAAVATYNRADEEEMTPKLLKVMTEAVDVQCFAVGIPYELSPENLRQSYLRASEAARYRFIYPEERLLSWGQLKISGRKSHGSHLKLFSEIEKDIGNENILDFKYHIEALRVSFQTGNYTIDYCLSTLRDLVTLLYQTIQKHQLDMWIVFGYDIREYYKLLPDLNGYCEWINKICEVLFTNICQKKKPEDEYLRKSLERMIEEYLEKDITLDYLSDRLSVRPDVLSRTFRQLMGISYTEYVKEKKLNRAIELINQDYSMKDIASRLGYSSPQYFIKVFKETYGITPYQYKKKKNLEGEEGENSNPVI